MIYLEARCRHADTRVELFVEALADKHKLEIQKEFAAAKKRLGITPFDEMVAVHNEQAAYYRAMLDTYVTGIRMTAISPYLSYKD